ncbi:hypothetical protein [Capillimicrobium parvum]|uniref:Uncharacterized protein n=1 Tax=Capillimicrobium parvum TaxID=2884022 RepID=A0A9E6XUE4_9ACTN|nr:hypothetical protein [Capillimicrobium parvum]UGS34564.1 hypothetical protein DSM104329_00943 [Capillimicrobium parvum]
MRLSEELARILPARRKRRPADQAPREIVPARSVAGGRAQDPEPTDDADPFDAARERLRSRIPPPGDVR